VKITTITMNTTPIAAAAMSITTKTAAATMKAAPAVTNTIMSIITNTVLTTKRHSLQARVFLQSVSF
jgi:hypothetical protein